MKACFCLRLALGLLPLLAAHPGRAQQAAPAAVAAPAAALPGYWNLETNRRTRDYTIVRFYDGRDQLVYEERLPQVCLNLARGPRRCRQHISQQLALALQAVLRDPAHAAQATAWLSQQLGHSRREQRLYAVH